MRFFFFLISLIFLLPFAQPLSAEEREQSTQLQVSELTNLSANWLFRAGDSDEYSKFEYNDKDWETLHIFENWNDREKYADYRGIAWYRIHLTFKTQEQYAVFFSKTEAGVQFFFNGKLVYQSRRDMGKADNFIRNKGRPDFFLLPSGEMRTEP